MLDFLSNPCYNQWLPCFRKTDDAGVDEENPSAVKQACIKDPQPADMIDTPVVTIATAPASSLQVTTEKVQEAVDDASAVPMASMSDICQGIEWRVSLSTLAICASINWSPQQTTDMELNVERSPQHVESS